MDAKLFKSFTPLINTSLVNTTLNNFNPATLSALEDNEVADPVGSQWRSMGFTPVYGVDEFHIDVQGAATLICVGINERMLPGTVLREKVMERCLKYKEETGREKLSKKQIMEIKDDVVLELLPKAFIRRKLVPVMFIREKIVIFTSSAKVCDDVTLLINTAAAGSLQDAAHLSILVENNISGALTALAKDGQSTMAEEVRGDSHDTPYFGITNVGVLKGPNKQTIAVKDKDMGAHDIQDLLKQDYTVVKLGIEHFAEGQDVAESSFTLNDKLVFSQFKVTEALSVRGKSKEDADDTFMTTAYIVARAIDDVIDTTIHVMGGIKASDKVQPAVDTDDEL